MSIKEALQTAMKVAMKAQDKKQLGVIRLMLSEIKQVEVDQRVELTDEKVLIILDKMLKQRRDSMSQYSQAQRMDLVEQENFEIEIIKTFMPEPLSEDQIDLLVSEAIALSGATSIKDMAKIMAQLKPALQGRADLGMVAIKIKNTLS